MLRVSDSKLYSIRQQIVRQLPLPEEMSVQLDLVHLQELLQTIEGARSGADFDLLVARLPRRQLNGLFGLLLVIESHDGGQTFLTDDVKHIRDRIFSILERRATLSLAQTGWAFYQQHFFHADLAEAMTRISRTLAAKGETAPFLVHCSAFGSGEDLPAKIAAFWIDDLAKPINALNKGWVLSRHLKESEIIDRSRFATLLLHAFFMHCPLERIAAEASLFASCLEMAVPDEQAQLLGVLYGSERLEPTYTTVGRSVVSLCGIPRKGNEHPVWAIASQQVRQHFRQWALIDTLNQHIGDQARKQVFYQPLHKRIFDCNLLSPDVLLLEFGHFYLVDHSSFSHQIIYYDRPTMEMALESRTPPEDLAMPLGQLQTAREIILTETKANRVLLKLEEVNLLYARDFVELMMNPKKRGSII